MLQLLRRLIAEQEFQKFTAPYHTVLDDLRHALGKDLGRQRVECLAVTEHKIGLREGSDQVLTLRQVDRGLAADRGIHHREQRGRNLNTGYPAEIERSREPRKVACHTAAERNHDILSRELCLGKKGQHFQECSRILRGLTRRERKGLDRKALLPERLGRLLAVERPHIGVRHNDRPAPANQRRRS